MAPPSPPALLLRMMTFVSTGLLTPPRLASLNRAPPWPSAPEAPMYTLFSWGLHTLPAPAPLQYSAPPFAPGPAARPITRYTPSIRVSFSGVPRLPSRYSTRLWLLPSSVVWVGETGSGRSARVASVPTKPP